MNRIEERRQSPRIDLTRLGKLYDPRSRKFLPCSTCNLSRGGAMLEVVGRLPLCAGDRLMLGLPTTSRQALVTANEMVEVEVVRALPTTDNRQGIAVRFVAPAAPSLALAA